ncbi:MAG: universal stress protein [Myxococcota bacterium]
MKIIAATDLTDGSRRVVDLALEIAAATGAELDLCHVVDLPPEPSPLETRSEVEPALEALRARVRERVEKASAALEEERRRCAERGVECRTRLVEGHPWEAVIEEATRAQAALLVVGPHGSNAPTVLREAIRERLLGSTADRVVRHAPCPVLVATGDRPIGNMRGSKWLVGVDFSPASRAAVQLARKLAEPAGAQLVLTHTVPPTGLPEDDTREPTWRQLLREESRKQAEAELRSLAADEGGGADIHQGERASYGPPAEELCRAASETSADLLVLGSHGKKGLTRLLLGSTAERCLRRADIPVLVVKPADTGAA